MNKPIRIKTFAAVAFSVCMAIMTQTNFAQSVCSTADAHLAKGKELLATGLSEEKAEAEFSVYIKCKPRKSEGYSQRAYARSKETSALFTLNFDSALADIAKALSLDPRDSTAYLVRGMIANEKKNYAGAVKDCSEAIRLAPASDEAYLYRGFAYANLQQLDNAVADITKAIDLKPTAFLYDELGLVHSMQKRFAAAVEDYKHALAINPIDSIAKNGLQAANDKVVEGLQNDKKRWDFEAIAVSDPSVIQAANFAFTVNAKKDASLLKLNAIQEAEIQVIVGTTYRLCVEVNVKPKSAREPSKLYFQTTIFYNMKQEVSVTSWSQLAGTCLDPGWA